MNICLRPSSRLDADETAAETGHDDANDEEQLITEDDLVDPTVAEYDAGGYSPQLIRPFDLPPDTIIFDPEDDMKRLEFARHQIVVTGQLQVATVCLH